MELLYTIATTEDELHQILALQKDNIRNANSMEEEKEQGFVTVQHDLTLLKMMNEAAAHVIAKDADKVVGYALAMTREFKNKIPVLKSMFDLLDELSDGKERIGNNNYVVMGQICIEKGYRGKGIFQNMYRHYFQLYKPLYEYVITEVAARNTRSLKAHLNVGFREVYRYEEKGFETWIVLLY